MALVKVYLLVCDGALCNAAVQGVTRTAGAGSGDASNATRKKARREGWRRRHGAGGWSDFCPRCDPGPHRPAGS